MIELNNKYDEHCPKKPSDFENLFKFVLLEGQGNKKRN